MFLWMCTSAVWQVVAVSVQLCHMVKPSCIFIRWSHRAYSLAYAACPHNRSVWYLQLPSRVACSLMTLTIVHGYLSSDKVRRSSCLCCVPRFRSKQNTLMTVCCSMTAAFCLSLKNFACGKNNTTSEFYSVFILASRSLGVFLLLHHFALSLYWLIAGNCTWCW